MADSFKKLLEKSEKDILKFVTALIQNTKGDGKSSNPFWEKAEQLLYQDRHSVVTFIYSCRMAVFLSPTCGFCTSGYPFTSSIRLLLALFLYATTASNQKPLKKLKGGFLMEFSNSAVDVLQTLVIALGAGLGVWGVINLLEGYGNDNPVAMSQGMKHYTPN